MSSSPFIPPLLLPEIDSTQVACIYCTDGKYRGMLIPERIDVLNNAFDRAKISRFKISRFTQGDLQPDCSADRP
eukprot:1138197-Pelagomonas_calceolata.AAC.1